MKKKYIVCLLLLSIAVFPDTYSVNVLELTATSTLPDLSDQEAPYNKRHIRYSADKILDSNPLTAWSENKDGPGIGESISLVLENPIEVDEISFMGGYFEDGFFTKNNRIRRLTLIIKGFKDIHLTLKDKMEKQNFTFKQPIQFTSITIRIDAVYPGSEWNDTCLAELGFSYKQKDISIQCPRVDYRNGRYYLPAHDPLIILIVEGEYPQAIFYLNSEDLLTGDIGPGNQMGKSIHNGSWEFNQKKGIITLFYSYYAGRGIGMGLEEYLPEPELIPDSAEFILLGINMFENLLSEKWDLDCAVLRYEDVLVDWY